MNLQIVPLLVVMTINLLFAFFVFAAQRKKFLARVFIELCLAVSFWCGAGVVYYLTGKTIWLKISFLAVLAIPAVYHCYLSQLEHEKSLLNKIPILIFLWALAFALLIFPWRVLPIPGAAEQPIKVVTIVLYLSGMFITFLLGQARALKKENSEKTRSQIRFEIWAVALPFAALLIQAVLALYIRRIPQANVGLAVVLGAELMLYSLYKHGAIDLSELLSKGMVYLVYLVLSSCAVMLVVSLVGRIPGVNFNASQIVIVLALTAISALVFAATRERLGAWVEQSFFPEKFEYKKLIARYEKELEAVRERLKQAEKLAVIGELSAQIAHDIRNPLGPIKGYTQMFLGADEQSLPEPAMVRKGLSIIAEEVNKIDERVEKLLQFCRASRAVRSEINMAEMVEQTVALFRLNPKFSQELKIEMMLEPGLSVFGDKGMLENALYNLVSNAAQAMNGKGAIEIKTFKAEAKSAKWVCLEVADTGPGIAPEDQEKIFEPFFTRRESGVGLGLSIVKRAIEEHKGWIEVKSEQGSGARFRIFLPDTGGGKNED